MIGREEFARIHATSGTLENADDVLSAWGIDIEAFAVLAEQHSRFLADQVHPLGPLSPIQALYTMFISGFEMGYLSRLEAELQAEASREPTGD